MKSEVTFLNNGHLVIPVFLKKKTAFFLEIEDIPIDVLTFSDYINYLW
jgi:hypothetical protein